MIRPITGTRNRLALPRKRGHLPANATYWPTAIGSTLEMWLATSSTPPVRGMFSWPRQSRQVSGRAIALMIEITAISAFSAGSVLTLRRPRADDDRRCPPGSIPD